MTLATPYANIHHYYIDPLTKITHLDDDGEPKIGYYWELMQGAAPLSKEHGPYGTQSEAEEACHKAWEKDDYERAEPPRPNSQ